MPNLLVDNLSDDVFTSLEVQARRHHRSPEAEARTILEESLTRRQLLVHRIRPGTSSWVRRSRVLTSWW